MINEIRHLDNQSYSTKNRNDSYIYDIPTCWYVGGNKTIVSKVCFIFCLKFYKILLINKSLGNLSRDQKLTWHKGSHDAIAQS